MLLYQAALPLSTRTLNFTARLIRAHRKAIRSRWRAIDPGQQALLTLAYMHQGHTYDQLAPGFGISRATAARRVHETIDLLSAQAPKLRAGLRKARRLGRSFVILDGILIRTDRPDYQVKHRSRGMNLQAVADADGNLLWISGAIRGSIHDTAAARIWQLPRLLREHGLFALGDKGYQGLDHDLVVTPYKGKGKPEYQKAHNRLHARLRGPGERMFAELKKWRILRKLRCDPHRATHIARAIATLNHQERQSR
ncbi:IS5/IS1182 family transposase [Glycomyces sp. NRRL B-16210]|uniref:IS5/IS1182 family transposase n=1 Tax=Glycomyces sp. NRRL B-16210 TaxID=1463821 RepID=UPI0004C18D36|nr:IS5/IS1182 family transposase [Glycomyces sp. NRRL B-16210]